MAAALRQYQACLGIMVRLQLEDLTALKRDFDRAARGLSLHEFVSVMLERVAWTPENVVAFVQDLVELFAQVDVNGDGAMEWEEFTSAIIEGGMSMSSSSTTTSVVGSGTEDQATAVDWRELQYEEHPRFVDALNRPPKRVQLVPELRRLLVHELARPVVEIVDPAALLPPIDSDKHQAQVQTQSSASASGPPSAGGHGSSSSDGSGGGGGQLFTPELVVAHRFHPLCYTAGYRRDQDAVRSERSPVQCLAFLSGVDLLAVSGGDLKLTFWAASLLTAASASAVEMTSPLAIVHTPRPQRVLEWNRSTGHLYSISADLVITVWRVRRLHPQPHQHPHPHPQSTPTHPDRSLRRATAASATKSGGICEVSAVASLKEHRDLLQDLLLLNSETLLSCGMDSQILVWDTRTLRVRASRRGHRRGVRLLRRLSAQLFVSAGFEGDVLGWDINALATTPIFRLVGHNAPVCCLELFQSSESNPDTSEHGPGSTSGPLGAPTISGAATTTTAPGPGSSEPGGSAAAAGTSGHSGTGMSTSSIGPGPVADQALTVDDDGWFRWWTLADVVASDGSAASTSAASSDGEMPSRCLQSFRLGSDRYPWKAHSLAVLHHGQSIVAAGLHKLKLLHRVRLKPNVVASSVVLYNGVSFTLLTTTDRGLRIWDAASGALLRSYRGVAASDITCVDLDARQRKVVLGTQRGELLVLNYLNGALLKTWMPHQLHVAAVVYCRQDQTVLSVSWDRSLRLYDDNARGAAANTLLRCVTDAHDADIRCLAYCYPMALVATGSADGEIKLWDYIYFLQEESWSLGQGQGQGETGSGLAPSEVATLAFVEPYPLLLSGHDNGLLCGWQLMPGHPTTLLFVYAPFRRAPPFGLASTAETRPETETETETATTRTVAETVAALEAEAPSTTGISCCQVLYDACGGELLAEGIRKGRFLVATGSQSGDLCVDDLTAALARAHLRAFRDEALPSQHSASYNPRRRCIRQGKNASNRTKKKATGPEAVSGSGSMGPSQQRPELAAQRIALVRRWKAHRGTVRSLQAVEEPGPTLLSCSTDKTTKIWRLDGSCAGCLLGTQAVPPPPIPQTKTTVATDTPNLVLTDAGAPPDPEAITASEDEPRPEMVAVADNQELAAPLEATDSGHNRTGSVDTSVPTTLAATLVATEPTAPGITTTATSTTTTATTTATPSASTAHWTWEIDTESAAQASREHAEQLWAEVQRGKTQRFASWQLTAQAATRLRMRRSRSLEGLSLREDITGPVNPVSDHPVEEQPEEIEESSPQEQGQLDGNEQEEAKEEGAAIEKSAERGEEEEEKGNESVEVKQDAAPSAKMRLLGQLRGEETWTLSDSQRARQDAWSKERRKFQRRMQRIMKERALARNGTDSDDEGEQGGGRGGGRGGGGRGKGAAAATEDVLALDGIPGGGGGGAANALMDAVATLLPDSAHGPAGHSMAYDDKDNWHVGSLNRERQMYTHLYHENARRGQKQMKKKRTLVAGVDVDDTVDLTPSAFLLDRLGPGCVIRRRGSNSSGADSNARFRPRPRKSQSSAALPTTLDATLTDRRGSKKQQSQSTSALPLVEQRTNRSDDSTNNNDNNNIATNNASSSDNGEIQASAGGDLGTDLTPIDPISVSVPVAQRSISDLLRHYAPILQQQEAEETHRVLHTVTSKLQRPHRARSFDQGAEKVDVTHAAATRSATRVRRQGQPVGSATKERPLHRPGGATAIATISTATARMTAAEVQAKKQRMRADAALLRQSHFGPYPRDDVVNLYRTFQQIDKDGSGSITLRELADGAGLFGSSHLRENLMGIFSSIDTDQSGQIDLRELCRAVFHDATEDVLQSVFHFYEVLAHAETIKRGKKQQPLTPEQVRDLKHLFQLYDADHNGDIDVDELFSAMQYNDKFYDREGGDPEVRAGQGATVTKEDVQRIVARFDTNTNASLDLNEFIELFRDEL